MPKYDYDDRMIINKVLLECKRVNHIHLGHATVSIFISCHSLVYTYLLDYPAEIAIQKRKKIL